jgi:hypothetical protein
VVIIFNFRFYRAVLSKFFATMRASVTKISVAGKWEAH